MAITKRRIKVKSDFSFSARSKRLVFLLLPTRLSVFLFRRFIDDNRERNALEAAIFLVDANRIYATRYGRLIPKFLRFCLHLADLGLPKDYEKLVIESIWATHQNPKLRKQVNEKILRATSQLSQSDSTAQGWKLLTLTLNGFGFIRAGKVSRTNCLYAALNEVESGKASHRTSNLAIRGMLESRMFFEAFDTAHKLNLDPRVEPEAKATQEYIALLTLFNSDFMIQTETNERDRRLRDLVMHRNVALVATGSDNNEYGLEIDNHQIVARVKFQGHQSMPDVECAGRRCDVTFYTEDLVAKFTISGKYFPTELDFLGDVKFVVIKKKATDSIGKTPTLTLGGWSPTFLTTATSGTLFLFELVRNSPSKIKLFNFNFYTTRQTYNSALLNMFKTTPALKEVGLPANWFDFSSDQKESAIIASGFIAHDPLSDFLLIKNLYELSGLIDGTPEVLALLNLTADEYDLKLEEMLGDW